MYLKLWPKQSVTTRHAAGIMESIGIVANENKVPPIRDYLSSLCGTGQSESASAYGTFWELTQMITPMKR